jgi:hypothetical protein
MPRATLTRGPATAIRISSRGRRGSDSSAARPPKTKSVIERTRTPTRWATRLCPSSCRRIEAKKSRLVTRPTLQVEAACQSACASRSCVPIETVTSMKMSTQV